MRLLFLTPQYWMILPPHSHRCLCLQVLQVAIGFLLDFVAGRRRIVLGVVGPFGVSDGSGSSGKGLRLVLQHDVDEGTGVGLPALVLVAPADDLSAFGVPYEMHVYSAHRTPVEARDFAVNARANGFGAIIAAAGMAAHLACAIAANTTLPVI